MAGAPSRGDSSAAPPRPRSTLATAAKRLPGDNRRKLHPCAPPPRSRSPHLCLSHRAATPASADVFVHPSQEHPVFPPFDGSALCWAANLVLSPPSFCDGPRTHGGVVQARSRCRRCGAPVFPPFPCVPADSFAWVRMGVGLAYLWFDAAATCRSIRRARSVAAWERRRMGSGGLSARTRTHTRRRAWLVHDLCHACTQQTVAHPVANALDHGYLLYSCRRSSGGADMVQSQAAAVVLEVPR